MNSSASGNDSIKRAITVALWIGVLAASFALAVYMYLGLFTRYLADDYCLLVDLQTGDLFSASWDKYLYSSNRFSNLFVLGLWESLGPKNIAYVPALLIVLWVSGLFWFFKELDQLFDLKLKLPVLVLSAELLAVFSFYTAPNLFQAVYWRPGQVTYFTPLVFFVFLAAWLTRISRLSSTRSLIWQAPLFAFLAFFIGGLSETIGAFHVAAMLLAIAGIFFFDKSLRRQLALTLLIAASIGAFLALIVMLVSPANSLRIDPNVPPPGLLVLMSRSLQYAFSFVGLSIRTLPTPSAFTVLISALASYMIFAERPAGKMHPRFWLVFILIPLITYGLLVAITAPSAYGQSYPVERVRFPMHFVLTGALMSVSACLGYFMSQFKLPNAVRGAVLAILTLSLLYPVWTGRQYFAQIPYMREWSDYWDRRETQIMELKSQGEVDLAIPALSGYFKTKELDVRESYWANKCAAQYYGVNSIRAIPAPDSP